MSAVACGFSSARKDLNRSPAADTVATCAGIERARCRRCDTCTAPQRREGTHLLPRCRRCPAQSRHRPRRVVFTRGMNAQRITKRGEIMLHGTRIERLGASFFASFECAVEIIVGFDAIRFSGNGCGWARKAQDRPATRNRGPFLPVIIGRISSVANATAAPDDQCRR